MLQPRTKHISLSIVESLRDLRPALLVAVDKFPNNKRPDPLFLDLLNWKGLFLETFHWFGWNLSVLGQPRPFLSSSIDGLCAGRTGSKSDVIPIGPEKAYLQIPRYHGPGGPRMTSNEFTF
jgi:hypothetical protein